MNEYYKSANNWIKSFLRLYVNKFLSSVRKLVLRFSLVSIMIFSLHDKYSLKYRGKLDTLLH
jgi:hypothetical protein